MHPAEFSVPAGTAPERGWQAFSFRLTWLLVFSIPWGDMVLLPYDIQASRGFTVVAALAWVVSLFLGKRVRSSTASQLFMFLFIVWAGSNVFWTAEAERSARRILSYCQLSLDAWLVFQLARTVEDYRRILQAYVFGCYVAFCGLTYNFVNGVSQGDGRFTAPGFDPNDLAATLTLGLPIAWYLAFTTRNWLWLNRLYIPCALTAALLTASRNGLVTVAVTLAFPLLVMPKLSFRAKLGLFPVVLLCAGSVGLFWNDVSIGRLATLADKLTFEDMNGRVDIWQRGLEVFQQNPIVGVGAGAFGATVAGRRGAELAAHNTFLGVLVEHGAVGLLFFLAVILSLVRRSWSSPPIECRLWIVMLLAWGVTLSTLSWENREITWLLWGLCSAQPWHKGAKPRPIPSSQRVCYA